MLSYHERHEENARAAVAFLFKYTSETYERTFHKKRRAANFINIYQPQFQNANLRESRDTITLYPIILAPYSIVIQVF